VPFTIFAIALLVAVEAREPLTSPTLPDLSGPRAPPTDGPALHDQPARRMPLTAGEIYTSRFSEQRIRKVTPAGLVSTFAVAESLDQQTDRAHGSILQTFSGRIGYDRELYVSGLRQ